MRREVAHTLINETRDTYNKEALMFSRSRRDFWEELKYLAEHAREHDTVLDIGCGNGRFYPLLEPRAVAYTGIDLSKELISLARIHHPTATFVEGNALELPFEDSAFHIAYSFAVIHHIPSKKLREKFFAEAYRVLKPGGTLIITTWYLWDLTNMKKLFLPTLKKLLGMSQYEFGDAVIGLGQKRSPRYIHAYTMRELSKDIVHAGFSIVGSEIATRPSGFKNIVVIARKDPRRTS